MKAVKHCLAIAVVSLVAACGGGEQSASITPQGAMAALKQSAQAAPLRAATSEAAAEVLFAYAEANLGAYFPGPQTTQTYGPFRFRYYPATNVYLGVVVTDGQGYNLGHVYVANMAGGTLANPFDAGALTNYVTISGGGTGGGGTGNGCFDLALMDTLGTHIVLGYQYSGALSGTIQSDTTVGAMTTFEGHSARESVTLTSGTVSSQGQTVPMDGTTKSYTSLSGDAVTTYGMLSNTTSAGVQVNGKIVNSPPTVSTYYNLAQGASTTETSSGVTTWTYSIAGVPPQTINFSTSTTYTFVGTESVTVPAGTYAACKYTVKESTDNYTVTNWFIQGKGIHIKTQYTSPDGAQTIEATSVKLNGASL
jgi:hypothetical protein